MEIEDILGCIDDDIEIGARPVDAGLSNLGRVKGTVTEDNIGCINPSLYFSWGWRRKD